MDNLEKLKAIFGNINDNIDELEDRLNTGEVSFVFKKLDETYRVARGTRCLSEIPLEAQPKGKRIPAGHVLVYYDLEKAGWRCLYRSRLIGFLED